jgi:hypothetical protein
MAKKKWISVPGGRPKRWKKSRTDDRPGCGSTLFTNQVPPHWYRNLLNRRERRLAAHGTSRRETEARRYVHPRKAGWYW